MALKIFLFEDPQFQNFYPLTYNRPVYELLLGTAKLREKISWYFPKAEIRLLCRDYLEDYLREKTGLKVNDINVGAKDQILLLNGRVVPDGSLAKSFKLTEEKAYWQDTNLVALTVKNHIMLEILVNLFKAHVFNPGQQSSLEYVRSEFPEVRVEVKLLNYIWDFVQNNESEIVTDYKKRKTAFSKKKSKVDRRAALINPKQIYLGKKVTIEPQVVLNAKGGPIVIDDNSTIQAFTRIEGPAYIGKNTILYGAKVSAGCSIGPECRVGGEIQNSIILGYSNKYHDGFLGHSYLGEWVNLGAGTTTSDLKNNYSTIRVEFPGGNFDTGLKKVGSLLGDHVKTGIGTLLNTGAVLGLGSNIFGGGMPGIKFVPPFLWGDDSRLAEYNWDKFVANARTVMERRNLTLSDAERHALHKVFELTKSERIF